MKVYSLFSKSANAVVSVLIITLAAATGAGLFPLHRASAATVVTTGADTRVRLASTSAKVLVREKTSSIESAPGVSVNAGLRPAEKTMTVRTKAKLTSSFKSLKAARAAAAAAAAKARITALTNWKSAKVSWYGPGFYGHTMAGGGNLTPKSMVVAHRTMKFGTKVQISYKGKTVVAVVKDRGPFVAGRIFDLGPGTAKALGFSGVGTVKWRVVK